MASIDDASRLAPLDPTTEAPAIRTVAMPADTNPAGDIFGGWLMSQMDLAAGNLAARRAQGRSVTIAVDGMSQPARLKYWTSRSCFSAAAFVLNVPRFFRLPVRRSILRE